MTHPSQPDAIGAVLRDLDLAKQLPVPEREAREREVLRALCLKVKIETHIKSTSPMINSSGGGRWSPLLDDAYIPGVDP